VTGHGNRREAFYRDNVDRAAFQCVLAEVCERFNWRAYAWCQMGNYYHLLVGTPDGNLAAGMRQLNGVYTRRFNARYARVGHLFQARYSAIMVERESYLLKVARYVVLSPVRARMVRRPEEWPWSSYRASVGAEEAPDWLDVDWLLSHFGANRSGAVAAYRRFAEAGQGQPAPWKQLRNYSSWGRRRS